MRGATLVILGAGYGLRFRAGSPGVLKNAAGRAAINSCRTKALGFGYNGGLFGGEEDRLKAELQTGEPERGTGVVARKLWDFCVALSGPFVSGRAERYKGQGDRICQFSAASARTGGYWVGRRLPVEGIPRGESETGSTLGVSVGQRGAGVVKNEDCR